MGCLAVAIVTEFDLYSIVERIIATDYGPDEVSPEVRQAVLDFVCRLLDAAGEPRREDFREMGRLLDEARARGRKRTSSDGPPTM